MKRTLLLSLILHLFFGYRTQAQEPLKLLYYKHLARLNVSTTYFFNNTLLNENGWLFVRVLNVYDSLEFDTYKANRFEDDNGSGSIIFAFDNKGVLRWTLPYNKKNTTLGAMGLIGSGPNNSLYFACGARDSIVFDNGLRMDFEQPDFPIAIWGVIDSTGIVTKIINQNNQHSFKNDFTHDQFYNFGIKTASSTMKVKLTDSSMKEVIYFPLSSARSATIDNKLDAYFAYIISPNSNINILDTAIITVSGEYKWVLVKVSKEGDTYKRKWMHIVMNNKNDELQENKLVKVDRHGNVFWAVRHGQDIIIDNHIIPFYDNLAANQAKASILRFDSDGNYLGAHNDSSTSSYSSEHKQSIWLEYDKDMNVYAYFYSNSRVYNFDQVQFDETYSHRHKILIFDNNSKTFNKAYTHIGGRFDKSIAPPRFIFWHSLTKLANYTFLDGTFIEPKWDSDYAFTVMDTITPKYPVAVPQIPAQGNDITIYPNPSSNSFIITNNNKLSVVCSVYSMDMRLIEKMTLEGDATIEISSVISPGVYFVQCQNSEGFSQTIKIIKQ